MTKDQIIKEIRKFNGDTSRSAQDTLDGLEEIRDEAAMLADAIRETNDVE